VSVIAQCSQIQADLGSFVVEDAKGAGISAFAGKKDIVSSDVAKCVTEALRLRGAAKEAMKDKDRGAQYLSYTSDKTVPPLADLFLPLTRFLCAGSVCLPVASA
jgi:hypothetical protein